MCSSDLTCGGNLIAYGRTSGACMDHLCSDTNQLLLVPSTSGTTKLWIRDSSTICICEDGRTSGYSRKYSTLDSDISKVSINSQSVDSTQEVTC